MSQATAAAAVNSVVLMQIDYGNCEASSIVVLF